MAINDKHLTFLAAPTMLIPVSDPISNEQMVTFHMSLGFYEGQAREPSIREIEQLICDTNQYLQLRLRTSTGDLGLEVHAVNIDWLFGDNGPDPTFEIMFSVNAFFDSGSMLPANPVFQEFKMTPNDISEYLTRFVWKSTESTFINTNQVTVRTRLGPALTRGKLADVNCPGPEPTSISTVDAERIGMYTTRSFFYPISNYLCRFM